MSGNYETFDDADSSFRKRGLMTRQRRVLRSTVDKRHYINKNIYIQYFQTENSRVELAVSPESGSGYS